MAEPLVLSFQADTSKATSAMQSLASQLIGNMTSIGVAMAGGAANTNAFGGTLQGLASNTTKAAQAISVDVRKIATDTANAASKEGATLEGVVKSFTAAAAGSNTAQAAVSAGITGTSTAITTLVAQVPMLKTMLGVFLAFEAVKVIFDAISGSVDSAREHVEKVVKLGQDADRAGVSLSFFQRATGEAKELGLTVQQVTAALNHARDATEVKLGEGKGATNKSPLDDLLDQNIKAKNITPSDRTGIDSAGTLEEKYKRILDLMKRLTDQGKDLVAFDLAGKIFGEEFERQMRNGADVVDKFKKVLNSSATATPLGRIFTDEDRERADAMDTKLQDIARTFATALEPIQRDISSAALDTYDAFVKVEGVIAKVVTIASNLYIQISGIVTAIREFVAQIPYVGKVIAASNPLTMLRAAGEATGLIDPEPEGGSKPLQITVGGKGKGKNRGNPLPGHAAHTSSPETEQLDAVEQLISQIEKARDTAQAELETVGKTNVEREKAVALAKAEAAAREEFRKGNRTDPGLDADERSRVLAAAESWQTYRDRVMDAQQALRQAAEQARYFGQIAADSLSDAILEGKSFGDILMSLEKQLAKAALQAAFTGQGPLASLLGTAPAASAGGNAVGGLGSIFSLFGGGASNAANVPLAGAAGPSLPTASGFDAFLSLFRANGGDIQAGQPYTVGEAGRELFIPNQNGRMVPIERGTGSAGSSTTIDARTTINAPNADRAGLARLERIVMQQEASLPKRLYDLKRRGG